MDHSNGDLGRPLLEEKQRHVVLEGFTKYLLTQELLEMVALRGLMTILGMFLLESLRFSELGATVVVHLFFMGTLMSSIFGTLLSDGYMGKYRAIYIFSFCEFCGYIMLVTSAIPNAHWQSSTLRQNLACFSLLLVALGFGGLRPCTATFGGDQVMRSVVKKNAGDDAGDILTRQQKMASQQFFSAYYIAMIGGTLLSAILFPWIRVQGNGSYFYVFLLPACSMPLGTVSFWLGRKEYRFTEKRESPELTHGKHQQQAEASMEIAGAVADGNPKIAEESGEGFPTEEKGASLREDWKILVSALIVLSPTPFFTALHYQPSSTWVFQARKMDGHVPWLGGLIIPPDEIGAMKPIFVIIIIPILDEIVYPFVEKHIFKVTNLRKMVAALFMASLSFVMAGVLQLSIDAKLQEKQMGDIDSPDYADISRLWQVPQYVAISLAEVMMLIPAMEWAYHEAPRSMKTVVNAAHNAYQALGNLMIIVVVALLGQRVSKGTEDLVFAGLGAFGTTLMAIFSYTYVSRESRALQNHGKQPQD